MNPLWSRDNPRWRRLRGPGISAFICFWLLIGLGVWQLYRLQWKEGILAQIHVAEVSPPIALPAHPNRFEKVIVCGEWVQSKAVLYGDEVHDGPVTPVQGGQLIQPLREASGRVMLVDLGWVPERKPVSVAMPAGTVSVVGYIHKTESPGWFAGQDDPAAGLYYTLNPVKMGAAMGFADVAPFALVAMGPMPQAPGSPQPAQHLPQPPNNHYEYALTWFGFAIVLVFEFFFFARKRLGRAMNAYARLKQNFARIAVLDEASAMLGWDAAAMMPAGGAKARGEQMATLAGLSHELLAASEIGEGLAAAAEQKDEWEASNLGLMREAHLRATAIPRDLVEASSRANSACETLWRVARPASDFAMVRAALAEVVNLTRQRAEILGAAFGLTPYDALMGQYQRGIGAAEVRAIFDRYEAFLKTALPAAEAAQRRSPLAALPPGPYPAAVQEGLCRRLSLHAGLDYGHARLDRSAHPFCGGTQTDIRITTRYNEEDFCSALLGVLHETGHGLYEQNLPAGFMRQPVGFAAGMAVHESQSLIVEMQAVRSDAYLGYLAPELTAAFGKAISVEALKSRLRHVERSFIRVEADELTYPAHVILRFRLEQALVSGDLAVADLPGAWRDGMQAVLGITPPDDRQGCLQDIHWYDGALGYFPSYTLGAMAAAQLMKAARLAVPGLDAGFARGDIAPLTAWLTRNVHSQGSRLGFGQLLESATGEAFSPAAFLDHLTQRYLAADNKVQFPNDSL